MTTEEVSNELKIPVGTLRYFRSCGSGPASFRLAGRVRYRRADVFAWVEEQERRTRRGEGVTDKSGDDDTPKAEGPKMRALREIRKMTAPINPDDKR